MKNEHDANETLAAQIEQKRKDLEKLRATRPRPVRQSMYAPSILGMLAKVLGK